MFGDLVENFMHTGFLIKFVIIMLGISVYVLKFAPVSFLMKIGFILSGALGLYMALAGKSMRQRQ